MTARIPLTVFLGHVVTGLPDAPSADALAVADGRIIAVGAQARALAAGAAEVVELGSGCLLPAFGDGHAHPMFAGLESQGPDLRSCDSVPAVAAAVRRWIADNPGEGWVLGAGYRPALAPSGDFDATWLDAVSEGRPVVLRASDYHTLWCNTEALRRAGITARTPDPRIGRIVRRPDGTPMGTLREWHACDLVLDHVPRRSAEAMTAAIEEAGRALAAAGVTWVQDAWVEPDMVEPYLMAAERGRLPFRVDLALRADPDRYREQRGDFAERRRQVEAADSPLVTARTVKIFADGVASGGTAALLEPYQDDPGNRGMPVWGFAELRDAVRMFDADGFNVHIHAIGDAGVRSALDAVEHATAANPPRPRRPVIAHANIIHPADLPRFARLGVIVNVEPVWAMFDERQEHLLLPRLGADRAALQFPLADLLSSGARMSFGSDWPVSGLSPLAGIQAAVTRRTPDGSPEEGWLPHQRIGVAEALRAATAGVAYQGSAEGQRGTLEVGRQADMVWLGDDPLTCDPMSLSGIPVLSTWLAGRRTHG